MVEETFEPGNDGELGCSAAWRCPEPAFHLAAVQRRRR